MQFLINQIMKMKSIQDISNKLKQKKPKHDSYEVGLHPLSIPFIKKGSTIFGASYLISFRLCYRLKSFPNDLRTCVGMTGPKLLTNSDGSSRNYSVIGWIVDMIPSW